MKKTILYVALSTMLFVLSCGNNPDNHGSSTPIDSTNLNGTAPVQYGAQDPANPDSPRNQGAFDKDPKANTLNHDDSVKKGLIIEP
ncbi:MAG: hypothetical protein JST82_07095 [Bacteroidetes bacterium]|nr:hypothetical protein [Bacteroidota bacterium]